MKGKKKGGREGVRKGEKGREGWESANSPCKQISLSLILYEH